MTDWLTMDASGTTIRLPFPPEGILTLLALTGIGLAWLAFLLLRALWRRATAGRAPHGQRPAAPSGGRFSPTRGRAPSVRVASGAAWRRIKRAPRTVTRFLKDHYLWFLLPAGFAAILWAFFAYVLYLPGLIGDLLTLVRDAIAEEDAPADTIRSLAYAFAAFAGALAILATIPFQLVRVWINERTAATAEQNLITDLINKAVEGLAAEKRISRIGRPVTIHRPGADDKAPDNTTDIEWKGEALVPPEGFVAERKDWTTFEQTVPNIEVRIGAILSLERVARTSDADHVRIMEILCAYIRENAAAEGIVKYGEDFYRLLSQSMPASVASEQTYSYEEGAGRLSFWMSKVPKPRADIQVAIAVLGRRSVEQIDIERTTHRRKTGIPYRLDLRSVNLRRADLIDLDLSHALLDFSKLEGANLRSAQLNGASMVSTTLLGADLACASLYGAFLSGATVEATNLQFCDLRQVDWRGVHLGESAAHFADFRGGMNLSQQQIDDLIGNSWTLLPDELSERQEPFYVSTCWEKPPEEIAQIVHLAAGPHGTDNEREKLEAEFFCGPDNPRRPTGTPLALDAPRPPGHPLDEQD